MLEDIKIDAYKVTCDGECGDYLIFPVREISLNLGREIEGCGWFIKNGKQYCYECGRL